MIVFFTAGFYMDAFGLYVGPNNSFSIGTVEVVDELSDTADSSNPTISFSINVAWDIGIIQSITSRDYWFPHAGHYIFTPDAGIIRCGLIPSNSSASGSSSASINVSSTKISFGRGNSEVRVGLLLLKRV